PATSNRPVSAITITGERSGPRSSTSSVSTSSTRTGPSLSAGERFDHGIDARGEGLDVGRLDRGEHPDAELVAAELAVAVGVEDAVGAERVADGVGRDRRVEV